MDNLAEMDKFLEMYYLPILNHEEIRNINRPMTSRKPESIIKNLPIKKLLVNSPKHLKKLSQIILKLLQKFENERMPPN